MQKIRSYVRVKHIFINIISIVIVIWRYMFEIHKKILDYKMRKKMTFNSFSGLKWA